jgi:hypothetical protein
MSWHIDATTLTKYQAGAIDRVTAASLEAHIVACDDCRGRIGADPEWTLRSWDGIAHAVMPGKVGLVERGLARVGLPGHVARLVAVSPVLRASFLLAVAIVTAFAALASASDPGGRAYILFVAVAPLVPVAGIAFAYGRLVDPAYELTVSSPIDTLRLLLIRAASVLLVSILAGLAAWPFVPSPSTLGIAAWLAPAMALTLLTLALASRFPIVVAAGVVVAAWVVLLTAAGIEGFGVFGQSGQAVFLAVAVLAAAAIGLRRDRYRQLRSYP